MNVRDYEGVYGVILAAGLSKRFGTDKMLHMLSGRPVFSWVLEAACESSLAGVAMVCREELLPHLPSGASVRTVINVEPEKGQSASMQLGLSALPVQASHVLFLLADQPLITSALINQFIALARDDATLACFSSDNYLGPPALFGRKWFERLKEIDGDSGAKRILLEKGNVLQRVGAQFRGQEKDIDFTENHQILEQLIEENRVLYLSR